MLVLYTLVERRGEILTARFPGIFHELEKGNCATKTYFARHAACCHWNFNRVSDELIHVYRNPVSHWRIAFHSSAQPGMLKLPKIPTLRCAVHCNTSSVELGCVLKGSTSSHAGTPEQSPRHGFGRRSHVSWNDQNGTLDFYQSAAPWATLPENSFFSSFAFFSLSWSSDWKSKPPPPTLKCNRYRIPPSRSFSLFVTYVQPLLFWSTYIPQLLYVCRVPACSLGSCTSRDCHHSQERKKKNLLKELAA